MDRGWLAVGTMAVLWAVAVSWLAIARHLALNTGFDLAVFAQVLWSTTRGRPFFTSLVGGTTNFLGEHFAPLVVLLAPLYGLWPDARLLLIVQSAVLATGAVPLFAFGRARLGTRLALLVVLAYLLSPLLHYVALFDFHEIALAVPLLMGAGAALLSKRPRATLLWLGLALLLKEEVALIAMGMGLYALLVQRRWRFGAALTAGALAWAAALFGWWMPAANQEGGSYSFLSRYGAMGQTFAQVLHTLFTRPASVVRVVATRAKLTFVWQVLAPVAGLPLAGWPAALLILPPLAYLLLADYEFMSSIRFHYTAPLLPFLFLATVVALHRLGDRSPRCRQAGAALLCVSALLSAWQWSPFPGGRAYEADMFAVTEEDRAARRLLETVPADAALVSDWTYMPWLANRWRLDAMLGDPFRLSAPGLTPDLLLTRTPSPAAVSAPIYPWIVREQPGQPLRVPRFSPERSTPGGLVLWKWRGPEYDVLLSRYDESFEGGLVLVAAGLPPEGPAWGPLISVQAGATLPVWVAWMARSRQERRITFTLHLVDAAGERRAQIDQEMGAGHFPVTLWHDWLESPLVTDEFRLLIPRSLPPGQYRLLAGAYDSETVSLLHRSDGEQWYQMALVNVIPPTGSTP